jgi:hypothetical protein
MSCHIPARPHYHIPTIALWQSCVILESTRSFCNEQQSTFWRGSENNCFSLKKSMTTSQKIETKKHFTCKKRVNQIEIYIVSIITCPARLH